MSFTTDSDITPSDDPAPMPFSQALQPHGHMNACAISPESVSGKPAGKPSDMYQFGLLLYYMYTGNWPLAGLRQSMARNKVGGRVGGALADTGPPLPPLKRFVSTTPVRETEDREGLALLEVCPVTSQPWAGSSAVAHTSRQGPAAQTAVSRPSSTDHQLKRCGCVCVWKGKEAAKRCWDQGSVVHPRPRLRCMHRHVRAEQGMVSACVPVRDRKVVAGCAQLAGLLRSALARHRRVRAAGCHRLLFHTFTELKPVQCFPKENTPLSREEHGASSYWMSWFGPGPYTVNSLGVRGAGSARCTRACDTATREAARRRRKEVVPTRSRLSSRAHHTKLLDLAVEGSAAARRLRTFTSPVSSSAFHAPTRSAGHDRPASGPVQLHPSRILKPVQRLHFPEPFFQVSSWYRCVTCSTNSNCCPQLVSVFTCFADCCSRMFNPVYHTKYHFFGPGFEVSSKGCDR